MSESEFPAEELNFTREQVVNAFKVFPEKGFTNPDDLPLSDTDVISANALLQVWTNQRLARVQEIGTPEAEFEFRLERSTIFVDAGFSDPDYLDEVAFDWLSQDLQEAKELGLIEVASKIQARIDEIRVK